MCIAEVVCRETAIFNTDFVMDKKVNVRTSKQLISEHLFHLLMSNQWVILLKHFFLVSMIVIGAVVSFRVAVFWAVHITTFTLCLY